MISKRSMPMALFLTSACSCSALAAGSGNVPFNGSYVSIAGNTCGIAGTTVSGDFGAGAAVTNQSTFAPATGNPFSTWLVNLSPSVFPPPPVGDTAHLQDNPIGRVGATTFRALGFLDGTPPDPATPITQTELQWGTINMSVQYSLGVTWGTMASPPPPLGAMARAAGKNYFIVSSFTIPASFGGGTGYFMYMYIPAAPVKDWVQYRMVFNQVNSAASSAAGISDFANSCAARIDFHQ